MGKIPDWVKEKYKQWVEPDPLTTNYRCYFCHKSYAYEGACINHIKDLHEDVVNNAPTNVQLKSTSAKKARGEFDEQRKIVSDCKSLAVRLNVPVVSASQEQYEPSELSDVDIKIAIAVGKDGRWYAYGSSDHKNPDEQAQWAMDALDSKKKHIVWVEANVPVPEPIIKALVGILTKTEKDYIATGDKIPAIKSVKARLGTSLRESKDIVDKYIADNNINFIGRSFR